MAKKKKPLSQSQIWDDSALLQSWDEALEEYKLYHSIHAKGERVEDVIRAAEAAEAQSHGNHSSSPIASTEVRDANKDDLEDGELQDESVSQTTHAAVNNIVTTADKDASSQPSTQNEAPATDLNNASMPTPILAGVRDEALKNLMMSWYYAGYYTGLYEGQQKAA